MLKIGHRGAKGQAKENTLPSFEKALQLGVDAVELDVHLSSDGTVMVIHDETIDRTTSKSGFVNDYTSSELQQFGVPTLQDVIDLINKKCIINIEIKDVKASDPVIAIIKNCIAKENWNYRHFQVSSFDWNILEKISLTDAKILIGVLTEDNLQAAITFAQKINAYSINPFYKILSKETVTLLHENNVLVFPWTANEPHEIARLKSFEVDGIISDFPDRL